MKEQYDVGYNLTEEIRQLMDADYKKDINNFEIAKQHILLLLGKPDVETKEYTDMKEKLTGEFYKILDTRLKEEHNEQTIGSIAGDLEAFFNAYNNVTLKYMDDTLHFLMEHVNR